MVKKAKQPVVKTVDVEQNNRLPMQPKRMPGQHLKEFLERAEAAWKCNKSVSPLANQGLTSVHGIGDVKLCDAVVCNFEIDQHLGDHPDYPAAGGKRSLGHGAHQSNSCATVDDADVVLCQCAAQHLCGPAVDRISAVGRRTEDCYVLNGNDRWRHLSLNYPPPEERLVNLDSLVGMSRVHNDQHITGIVRLLAAIGSHFGARRNLDAGGLL